jgi:coatomer subunit gamma
VEGPKTSKPTKYIRYIYNRVVLENAVVRAAAVMALAKFGAEADKGSSIRASIKVLLTRCLSDLDDEVRDRAAVNLKFLDDENISAKFIKNGIHTS